MDYKFDINIWIAAGVCGAFVLFLRIWYIRQIRELKSSSSDANRRLVSFQREYHDLVNTLDGIVWEAEASKAGYRFVSQQAEHILGYPLSAWYEQTQFWQQLLHPDDRSRLTGAGYISANDKQDAQIEYRVRRADGRYLWVRDYIKVITDTSGKTKMRGIMVDITPLKTIEAKLQAAETTATEALKIKTEFLANMSHEIRTPLNAIIGMTAVTLDTQMTDEQRENLETIKVAGETLLVLINDILDFSKIEDRKAPLEISDFNLRAIAQNAIDVISVSAEKKGVNVRLDISDDVSWFYLGDSGRILQLLLNLLSNAVKFTPKRGSVSLSIVSSEILSDGQTWIRFEVKDSGVGIPSEVREKLFQPFTQADNSTARRNGGSGLGLSICKRLIEIMGGRIGFESVVDSGSTFWFELLLQRPEENKQSEPVSVAVVSAGRQQSDDHRRLRILVAEDNPANQRVIKSFMEKLHFKAEIVSDGTEAVNRYMSGSYDLILMDCQMPEMDGYEATRRIRQAESTAGTKNIPIIAFTAHALTDDRQKCEAVGMNDYISKPVSLDRLHSTILKWTESEVAKS